MNESLKQAEKASKDFIELKVKTYSNDYFL